MTTPGSRADLEAMSVVDLRKELRKYGYAGMDVLKIRKSQLVEGIWKAANGERLPIDQLLEASGATEHGEAPANGNGHGTQPDLASIIAQAVAPFVSAQAAQVRPEEVIDIASEVVTDALLPFRQEVESWINNSEHQTFKRLFEATAEMIRSEMSGQTRTVEVIQLDGSKVNVGLQHKLFDDILNLASLREHVMLVGPAGGGKTHVATAVSTALGIPFYAVSVGPQTTKTDLLGYKDANGEYQTSAFREAYEHGGVFLLDELDAGNAGVITVLNAALSNGHMSFPDAMIEKHTDFVCIAAANTFGRGADRMYVGRNQLDAATLDRFCVLDFDYDEQLEMALAGNDVWTMAVQTWRRRAWDLKERVVISPRASIKGAKLLAAGFDQDRVEQMVVWKGISPDIIRKIKGGY